MILTHYDILNFRNLEMSIKSGIRNFTTLCRFMGCENNNHSGFKIRGPVGPTGVNTESEWIEWLKKEGIEIDTRKFKSIRLCFRHFRQEDMRKYFSKYSNF